MRQELGDFLVDLAFGLIVLAAGGVSWALRRTILRPRTHVA